MLRWFRFRRAAVSSAVLFLLMTGCHPVMSTPSSDYQTPPALTKEVPLKFVMHNFEAFCYNTLHCSVIYNNHDFTILDHDRPSPAPPTPDYKKNWDGASHAGLRAFSAPAEVKWTAKDGSTHEASVDFDKIFKDRLIWHNVPKADMADFYSGPVAGDPDIFLEVNDHTVNVYTKMFIPTKTLQRPGHPNSDYRSDLFLAWSHTY